MFYNNINPVAFKIWHIDVRWYGIAWAIGFLIVYLFLLKFKKYTKIKDSERFILITLIFLLLGSKTFSTLYHPENLKILFTNPLQFFRSGFASIGAFFGLIFAMIYIKKYDKLNKKYNPLITFEIVFMSLMLALFFGRIANFINNEFVGLPCDCNWCVMLDTCRHPAQLYEAFLNLIFFFILYFTITHYTKRNQLKKNALKILNLEIFGYAIMRFFVEFFKDMPRFLMFNLTQWQVLIIAFLYPFVKKHFLKKSKNKI